MLSRMGMERERRSDPSNEQIHMGKIFTLLDDYDELEKQ